MDSSRKNFNRQENPAKSMLSWVETTRKNGYRVYWDKLANGIVLTVGSKIRDDAGLVGPNDPRYLEIVGQEEIKEVLYNYEDNE